MNKQGQVRNLGLPKRNNLLTFAIIGVVGAMAFALGAGVYNKWVAPTLDEAGITSSVAGSNAQNIVVQQQEGVVQELIVNDNMGDAATVTFQVYDEEADTRSEITPTLVVFDSKGTNIVNGVASSTDVSTTVGEQLIVGTNDAGFYLDTTGAFPVPNVANTYDDNSEPAIIGHTAAAEASLSLTAFDRNNVVLTADDDNENDADYSLSSGADQEQNIKVDLENGDGDSLWRVGAVCTFTMGDVDEYRVTESGWEKTAGIPDELNDVTLTHANDTAVSFTTEGYDDCYVPSNADFIDLHEFDNMELKTRVIAGSNDPTANTGDVFGLIVLDYNCDTSSDGELICDFFRHDDDEEVTDIGIAETIASPQGLQNGVMIELQ